MNPYGSTIKALRELHDYSQEQLGEVMGVKGNTVSDYETGRSTLKANQIVALARFYDVPTDVILGLQPIDVHGNQVRETATSYNEIDGETRQRISALELELNSLKQENEAWKKLVVQQEDQIKTLKEAKEDKQSIITLLRNERRA